MLSFNRKESILRRHGIRVEPFPVRALPYQARFYEERRRLPQAEVDADIGLALAVAAWRRRIEGLYEAFRLDLRARSAAGGAPPRSTPLC